MREGGGGRGLLSCQSVVPQLFLVDVESQVKSSLLSYCSYVQVSKEFP